MRTVHRTWTGRAAAVVAFLALGGPSRVVAQRPESGALDAPVATHRPGGTAAAPDEPAQSHLDALVGTYAPLMVGAEGRLELPRRIQVAVALGWMPRPYVSLINEVVVALGGYDEATARIIESALDNSMIARVSVGWRPFPQEGFELHAGYTLGTLGGSLERPESVNAVLPGDRQLTSTEGIPVSSTVHSFHVGVRWRLEIIEHLVLAATLEYFQVFASSSGIDLTGATARSREAIARASAAFDAYLDEQYTTYVKSPVIGVLVGYRFF